MPTIIPAPRSIPGEKRILQLLGANWPILLQLFISEIQDGEFTKPPTHARLEAIYRDRLVNGGRNQYCDGMFDRLHGTLEPVQSQTAAGIEELDHVLHTLKHDGYPLQEPAGASGTRFGSNILRDFWLRKTA